MTMSTSQRSLESMHWHDGNLVDFAFTIDAAGGTKVVPTAEVYASPEAADRNIVHVTCEGVTRFACTLDVEALKDHRFAGHIADGEFEGNNLRIYLSRTGCSKCALEAFSSASDHAPRVAGSRGALFGIRDCSTHGLRDCMLEEDTEPFSHIPVVLNLPQQLELRFGQEAKRPHLAMRRASSRTCSPSIA
jgi:hypothetical protein